MIWYVNREDLQLPNALLVCSPTPPGRPPGAQSRYLIASPRMINGDRNSWAARKKLSHWSQIAIPFAKWRIYRTCNFGNHTIFAKLCIQKLLGSLIMNLTSDFRNSRWRTKYGGHNILETQWFSWKFVLQGIWGRWLRFWHRISIFRNGWSNMADMKFWKLYDFRTTLYSGVFGVTNFKLDFQNSIWRIQYGRHKILKSV